ncbi:MAG TPA: glycosyltransferase family 87 protein [Herpetosiphonaceae bacterium]|nr:glycosyltransferase family 87 protein [Herpetosiphonaceae bacterium]
MLGSRRSTLIAAALAVLAGLLLLLGTIVPGLGRMTHGYSGYHTASYLLVRGEWGPQAYDNEWFIARVKAVLGQPIGEIIAPNLPTVTLLALPLAGLEPQPARDVWITACLPLLLGALALLALGPPPEGRRLPAAAWWYFAAFALMLPATRANFRIGQAYIVLLLLFALALFGLYREQDWLAGIALGAAFMLKSSGLPLWLGLALAGRWRALGWGAATCALIFGLSLPWIGLESWLAYPAALRRATSAQTLGVTAYQNTQGFFNHLLRYDARWNPAPLADWPAAAALLHGLVGAAATGLTLWLGRRAPAHQLMAALLVLSVVLLPMAEEHQFVLLLPAGAVLLHERGHAPASRREWLAALAAALLLLPSFYKGAQWERGWWALLAYPRLYAGWLLWLATLGLLQSAKDKG